MKRMILILLVVLAVTLVACEGDPLGDALDVWDDETVETTGHFDLYDTMTDTTETKEPPTIELPLLPG